MDIYTHEIFYTEYHQKKSSIQFYYVELLVTINIQRQSIAFLMTKRLQFRKIAVATVYDFKNGRHV